MGEDEPSGFRRTPLLHAPLECSYLTIWKDARLLDLKALKDLLGSSIRFFFKPPSDQRPCDLERVHSRAPIALRLRACRMGGPHLSLLPGRLQAFQKRVEFRISARDQARHFTGCKIREVALHRADFIKESEWIKACGSQA